MWVSVLLFGILAVRSPFPITWWKTHPYLVILGSEAIAYLPCVLLLGVILGKMFDASPVRNSLLVTAIALAVAFAGSLDDPKVLLATLRESPEFAASFLIGVPVVAFLVSRMWSNNRLERSRAEAPLSQGGGG
jgi:hypothetical protein